MKRMITKLKSKIFKSEPDTEEVFTRLYQKNCWDSEESSSGHGSTLDQTKHLRGELQILFKEFNIKSILDIPCGDFNWMKEVNLTEIDYVGADIVEPLIQSNQKKYQRAEGCKFIQMDIITSRLPEVDLILVRDCFVHLSIKEIKKAVKNIKKSGSKYLLTTTFTNDRENIDSKRGGWRPLNLQKIPLNFPVPVKIINEKCTEGNGKYADKSMALWKINEL